MIRLSLVIRDGEKKYIQFEEEGKKMAEECHVCYEHTANCKLVCGHAFCKACVKTWYTKGGTCPMCRKKVHYRRMPIKKWKIEAEEQKKNDIFQESFNELLEDMMQPLTFNIMNPEADWEPEIPRDRYIPVIDAEESVLKVHRKNVPLDELVDLEKTFRALKNDATPDEIDYILNDTSDYYSDRRTHLNQRTYSEFGHWYPHLKKVDRSRTTRLHRH